MIGTLRTRRKERKCSRGAGAKEINESAGSPKQRELGQG